MFVFCNCICSINVSFCLLYTNCLLYTIDNDKTYSNSCKNFILKYKVYVFLYEVYNIKKVNS